ATPDHLDEVQAILGVSLPKVLRRALAKVADGGFGPGAGLLSVGEIIRVTGRCRRDAAASGGWPARWLPVAELGEGTLACVILGDPAAPVVVVDPSALDDDSPQAVRPAAPSLAAWLGEWAAAPSTALPTR
ncbi:MAG TPA: SMI1/KNR4 family protein, partial [Iamia sp.]|nr:SMI1/KNR4 family protein [Iamia sp.]